MRAALTDIERQLRHPTTRRNVFTLDRSGVVFTKDRVWFDDAPRDEIAWPGSVEELIEAARTAEVMGRADQAATSYRRLMVIEPRLRDWGRFCLNDVAPSDIANSDQIT